MSTRTAASRPTVLLAAIAAIALSLMYLFNPSITAAFTAGENGHPTGGPYSDLKTGEATFTFETNATLTCDSDDNATSFTFTVDYVVTGTLPANAKLVIYLSPNNGAITGNSGGNDAAYIAAVESNFVSKDVSGLTGSGSFNVTLPITTSFQLVTGGVLGVFASEDPSKEGFQSWTSKTNSLNCTEVQSVPPSTEGSVGASASAPASVPASGESSVKAGTGTPAASTSNTALFGDGSNPLPTVIFSLILLASLGALAYANVKTVRSRI